MNPRRAVRHASQSGQATVEAALTLPIVLIALLLIVQVGIVVRDALALAQAAREGARAAAVSASDERARDAVERSAGPLGADRIEIEVDPPEAERRTGGVVSVRLAYVERLSIPIVSRILSVDLPLKASATMRLEHGWATPTPQATPEPTPAASVEPTAEPSAEPTPSTEATPAPEPAPSEPAESPSP